MSKEKLTDEIIIHNLKYFWEEKEHRLEALNLINRLKEERDKCKQELDDTVSMNEMYVKQVKENAELKDRIAELEKALEKEQINNLNCDTELQYKEKRIAELEKENDELKVYLKKSIDMQKQMIDDIKTVTKEVEENLASEIPNLLKQFAEKLKEKFNRQEERFAIDVTRFETDLNKVKESDLPTAKFLIGKATGQATMAEKAQHYIDETLKEFIGE